MLFWSLPVFALAPALVRYAAALAESDTNNNQASGYVNSVYFTSWCVNVPLYVSFTSNDQYVGESISATSRLRISLWAIFHTFSTHLPIPLPTVSCMSEIAASFSFPTTNYTIRQSFDPWADLQKHLDGDCLF